MFINFRWYLSQRSATMPFMIKKILSYLPFIIILSVSAEVWGQDNLVDLTLHPNQNLVEVRENFNIIENFYTDHHDRRKLFVHIYSMVTDGIEKLIQDREIENGAWLENVIVGFSEEYRKAVLAYETKQFANLPLPWKFDFDQAQSAKIGLSTQLLLSLDSHILHDLPLVISRNIHGVADLAIYRDDYFRLNKMFVELIPDLFQVVYQEEGRTTLKAHSAAEIIKYKIVDEVVILMRQTAWNRALKMASLQTDVDRLSYKNQIAMKTEKFSELILTLDPFLNTNPGQLMPSNTLKITLKTIAQMHTILEAE